MRTQHEALFLHCSRQVALHLALCELPVHLPLLARAVRVDALHGHRPYTIEGHLEGKSVGRAGVWLSAKDKVAGVIEVSQVRV